MASHYVLLLCLDSFITIHMVVLFLRIILSTVYISGLFLFIKNCHSILGIYPRFFIHPADSLWVSFTIIKKAFINILIQEFFWSCIGISFEKIPKSRIARS